MTFLQRTPVAQESTTSETSTTDPAGNASAATQANKVPLTRAGAAWAAISAAALGAILLIIFLVQNTRQVRVDFLGMSTSTSLALMLLIAAVGGILIAVVLGTARMVQLRRIIRGRGPAR